MSNPVSRLILKIERLHKWRIVLDGGKCNHHFEMSATEARFAGYREGYWANFDSKGKLESVTQHRVYFGKATQLATQPRPASAPALPCA